ncbi:MAG TPA: PAS domain S-box protein, partial [Thermoanaerobaculia bacterium]
MHGVAFAALVSSSSGGVTSAPAEDADLLDHLIDIAPVPIVVLSLDGTVVIWNHASEQLFGWPASEVIGKENPSTPPELREQAALLREAALRGERRVVETWRVRRNGEPVEIVLTAAGLRTRGGEVRYGIEIVHDLTEFRAIESRAGAAEARARAVFENVTELGVLFVGTHGRVVDANRGAELLLDRSTDEIIEADIRTLLEVDPAALTEPNVQPHFGTETLCRKRDGSRFWADVVIAPIRAASGTVTDYVLLLRDVSRRKREYERERQRMQQSAAVAAFAQRATREATPEAVVETAVEHLAAAMQVDYTEVLTPVAGGARLSSAHAFTWEAAPELGVIVDPAGTIYADALAQRAPVVRELHAGDYAAAPHLRTLGLRWGAAIAMGPENARCTMSAFSQTAIAESDMYPLQSIATISEAIIARRRAEFDLAERDRTLTMILDQMPAVLSTFDRQFRFSSVQGAGLRLLAGRRDSKDLTLFDIAPHGSPAHLAIEGALRGESSSYVGEYLDRLYENRVEPLRNSDGEIEGAVNLGIDITERRRDEEALRASREELRRLSARLNKLQEEERRRIAHELHDELGQRL